MSLDPHDGEALTDLGEFYTSGAGSGGRRHGQGTGAVARRWRKSTLRERTFCCARIAESRKDYATAEREYKQATSTGEHPAFGWITLSSFYRKRERWDDMEAAVEMRLQGSAA